MDLEGFLTILEEGAFIRVEGVGAGRMGVEGGFMPELEVGQGHKVEGVGDGRDMDVKEVAGQVGGESTGVGVSAGMGTGKCENGDG